MARIFVRNVIQFRMLWYTLIFLVKTIFWLPVVKCSCPVETDLLKRLGDTRFYIVHANERGNYVSFEDAFDQCTQYGLQMARIKNMMTMALVGRELEEEVEANQLQDTWYWLDAKFNPNKDIYEWGQTGTDGNVHYSNFLYRPPRPTGVAGFLNYLGEYHINHDLEQCLALALPWPGKGDPNAGGVVFGHHTIIDERPCESEQMRHVICESMDPKCEASGTGAFVMREDKVDYFEQGNWIFGDRRYLVNWKHRTLDKSQAYCASLGLEIFKPDAEEPGLLYYLKMWTREVTTSQFWTGHTLNGIDKTLLEPGNHDIDALLRGKGNDTRQSITTSEEDGGALVRSDKLDSDFCIAMAVAFEFKGQMPCDNPDSPNCIWNFVDYVPANCNNYLATICQHSDKTARKSLWDNNFLNDVDAGLRATALTKEFGYAKNTQVLRSKYKQTFGSCYCVKGYRMLRHTNNNWHLPPKNSTTVLYPYDYKETYWVVDAELFDKKIDSQCTISEQDPVQGDGHKRRLRKVKCTEWHFYACEKITNPLTKPFQGVAITAAPKMVWKEGPQPRLYPIYRKSINGDGRSVGIDGRSMGIDGRSMGINGRSMGVSLVSEEEGGASDNNDEPVRSYSDDRFTLKEVNHTKMAFSLWKIKDKRN